MTRPVRDDDGGRWEGDFYTIPGRGVGGWLRRNEMWVVIAIWIIFCVAGVVSHL